MADSDQQNAAQALPLWSSRLFGSQPDLADALEVAGDALAAGESGMPHADVLALRFPGTPPDVMTPSWLRLQARQLLREFLGAVPRSEPTTLLTFLRPDGTPRTLTRAQLSAAIDLLRPRQRQSVRLALEARWPHKRVCEYINGVSLRTLERDLAEALDLLARL